MRIIRIAERSPEGIPWPKLDWGKYTDREISQDFHVDIKNVRYQRTRLAPHTKMIQQNDGSKTNEQIAAETRHHLGSFTPPFVIQSYFLRSHGWPWYSESEIPQKNNYDPWAYLVEQLTQHPEHFRSGINRSELRIIDDNRNVLPRPIGWGRETTEEEFRWNEYRRELKKRHESALFYDPNSKHEYDDRPNYFGNSSEMIQTRETKSNRQAMLADRIVITRDEFEKTCNINSLIYAHSWEDRDTVHHPDFDRFMSSSTYFAKSHWGDKPCYFMTGSYHTTGNNEEFIFI